MPLQNHNAAIPRRSNIRRQNRACDQCRKSKRACDAESLSSSRRQSYGILEGQHVPCSYCLRTRRDCTMNWALSKTFNAKQSRQQQRQENQFEHAHPSTFTPYLQSQWEPHMHQTGLENANSDEHMLAMNRNAEPPPTNPMNFDLSALFLDCGSEPSSLNFDVSGASSDGLLLEDPSSWPSPRSIFDHSQDFDFSFASYAPAQPQSELELDQIVNQSSMMSPRSPQNYRIPDSLPYHPRNSPQEPTSGSWQSLDIQSNTLHGFQTSLSPFSIDQQMINKSNHSLTSNNLLRIYHDVLEHNLSCWLTEMTCPYYVGPRDSCLHGSELGSSWSNRIYQRTIKLDRVARSCRLVSLTHSQDQAVSKALHLALMAFAAQWAQGSSRYRERYPPLSTNSGQNGMQNEVFDEFDRALQMNLWDQAKRSLLEVADLESYRVVCAELIFSLVQKPWDPDTRFTEQELNDRMCKYGRKSITESAISLVYDTINEEQRPEYLERAARKMHVLKYRNEALENGLGRHCGGREKSSHRSKVIDPEDRATVGLLYWLTIMFDTISSSMNERPVVVLDEDCEHEEQKIIRKPANQSDHSTGIKWDVKLFMQGGVDEINRTRWPCSYQTAADDIIQSAPVKVLLFRHLSYLQNAIRRKAHEEQVEDIIRNAISLYQYWNKTHGAFFGELIQNYSLVPQRVQGWFICISAHWHLAVLMLADLLEVVDENFLGAMDESRSRMSSQVSKRIRSHSAKQLSIIAKVATPDASMNVAQMSDFHHAVNEGTLLMEPWTIILIRAFAKAIDVFLDDLVVALHHSRNSLWAEQELEDAENCLKGLWLLGKKSDMARNIAEILSFALNQMKVDLCL